MDVLQSYPNSLHSFILLVGIFLILFEHIVVAIPINWMRSRRFFFLLPLLLFIFFIGRSVANTPDWRHYSQAKKFNSLGLSEQAEAAIYKALEFNLEFYRAYMLLANMYYDNDRDKARECYLLAIRFLTGRQKDPRNLKICYANLASLFEGAFDLENAWTYHRKAFELKVRTGYESLWWPHDPNHPRYYVMLNDKSRYEKTMSDRVSRLIMYGTR